MSPCQVPPGAMRRTPDKRLFGFVSCAPITHFAPCGRYVQTVSASQITMRAGARRPRRCAPGPGGPGLRQAQTVLRTVCVRAQPRRRRNRPCQVPPGASSWPCFFPDSNTQPRRRCRAGRDAPVRRREAQRPWPRAQRASTTDLAHLFERSAKRVASYAPGQGREHRRAVGAADRLTEASRPALHRLRRHRTIMLRYAPLRAAGAWRRGSVSRSVSAGTDP